MREIKLAARLARFNPGTSEPVFIKKGETVRFTVASEDVSHTFTAAALGIDVTISGGQTRSTQPVTFNETKAIAFLCQFHQPSMSGTIQVVETLPAPTPTALPGATPTPTSTPDISYSY